MGPSKYGSIPGNGLGIAGQKRVRALAKCERARTASEFRRNETCQLPDFAPILLFKHFADCVSRWSIGFGRKKAADVINQKIKTDSHRKPPTQDQKRRPMPCLIRSTELPYEGYKQRAFRQCRWQPFSRQGGGHPNDRELENSKPVSGRWSAQNGWSDGVRQFRGLLSESSCRTPHGGGKQKPENTPNWRSKSCPYRIRGPCPRRKSTPIPGLKRVEERTRSGDAGQLDGYSAQYLREFLAMRDSCQDSRNRTARPGTEGLPAEDIRWLEQLLGGAGLGSVPQKLCSMNWTVLGDLMHSPSAGIAKRVSAVIPERPRKPPKGRPFPGSASRRICPSQAAASQCYSWAFATRGRVP